MQQHCFAIIKSAIASNKKLFAAQNKCGWPILQPAGAVVQQWWHMPETLAKMINTTPTAIEAYPIQRKILHILIIFKVF